jgi:hypothetical protein
MNINELELWIDELKLQETNRNHKDPVISKLFHERVKKYLFIDMGSTNRFAIEINNGQIYESKNYIVNRKKALCLVEDWRDWDWSTYYPFKRSLYDWEQRKITEKPTKRKRARKNRSWPLVETISNLNWPYTRGNGQETGNSSCDPEHMGEQRTPMLREDPSNSPGENTRDCPERRPKRRRIHS